MRDADTLSASRWRFWTAMIQRSWINAVNKGNSTYQHYFHINCSEARRKENTRETFLKTDSSPQRYTHINSYSNCIKIFLASQPIRIVTYLNTFLVNRYIPSFYVDIKLFEWDHLRALYIYTLVSCEDTSHGREGRGE